MNTPSKKVARAAQAGSGPSRRQMSNISWGYFGTLAAIALVGIALVERGSQSLEQLHGFFLIAQEERVQQVRRFPPL